MPSRCYRSRQLKARAAQATTKVPAPFVVVALATAFPQIKPAKINLSLFGRLLGALEGADHVDLIEGAIGSEVDDDRKAEGKHHGKHVAQRLDFDVKVQ